MIKKPRIPKINRPSISRHKHIVSKLPSLSKRSITAKSTDSKSIVKKLGKISLGTCYVQKNCKVVLTRKVTKSQCQKQGGKSWKKTRGTCENL